RVFGARCEGSTPSPRTCSIRACPKGRRLGDRLTVGHLALNQRVEVRILLPELGTAADRAESPTGVEEDGIPRALGARDTGFDSLDADCYRAVVLGTPDRLQICRRSGSIPDGPAPRTPVRDG